MNTYIWLVVLILLAALLFRGNVRGSKKFIFVAFLLMLCVMGLRDVTTVGNDSTTSYRYGFQSIANDEWSELYGSGEENYNIGFSYLTKLGYVVTSGDYQMFILLLSAFLMFSYARFVKKYSPSPLQSVLCFLGLLYFVFLFDALKQAVAMAILLFAYDAIIDKKPIKFILITLLAASFHFPALVFLPAYWIGRMKVGRGYVILIAALLLVTFIFRDQILRFMLGAYGGEEIEANMDGIKFLRNKAMIMIVIVIAAVIIRPPANDNMVYNSLLMFAGIAIVFQTFCGYNNIFERLADYYFHTAIVFIPLVFEKNIHGKQSGETESSELIKTAGPVLICAFAIWRFATFVGNSPLLMPYKFFWQ